MMNFYQFFDKLNGKPHEDETPPPAKPNFIDYLKGNINGSENGSYELTPLTPEDMCRYSQEDVAKNMEQMKKAGFNPTRLGDPMSDEEFAKFHGL